jgi:hypothetical protein
MLDDLDSIPWPRLTHAYGSAADVPALLRALRDAPADQSGEDSPLWCLFGNIWHQGTVYEATAYAVPFLIEIAQDKGTQDRVGVLALLAEIANGTSYRAVHGNLLEEPDFMAKQARELGWVDRAHAAVAAGFPALVGMSQEEGEVRLAALHVLAQLPEHAAAVSGLLQDLLTQETDSLQRAGLLLLLAQTAPLLDTVPAVLSDALTSPDVRQRRAATLALARIHPQPLTEPARQAMREAIAQEDIAELLGRLPWDVEGEFYTDDLRDCLDDADHA